MKIFVLSILSTAPSVLSPSIKQPLLSFIQFAYGRTNFVGWIAASRSHRRTDSTVRPTPGTTDVRIRYSWYEVPYWYEYLLPACMQGDRQEGRHPERIPNAYRTHIERISNA